MWCENTHFTWELIVLNWKGQFLANGTKRWRFLFWSMPGPRANSRIFMVKKSEVFEFWVGSLILDCFICNWFRDPLCWECLIRSKKTNLFKLYFQKKAYSANFSGKNFYNLSLSILMWMFMENVETWPVQVPNMRNATNSWEIPINFICL